MRALTPAAAVCLASSAGRNSKSTRKICCWLSTPQRVACPHQTTIPPTYSWARFFLELSVSRIQINIGKRLPMRSSQHTFRTRTLFTHYLYRIVAFTWKTNLQAEAVAVPVSSQSPLWNHSSSNSRSPRLVELLVMLWAPTPFAFRCIFCWRELAKPQQPYSC